MSVVLVYKIENSLLDWHSMCFQLYQLDTLRMTHCVIFDACADTRGKQDTA